jgi:hypothetical protein
MQVRHSRNCLCFLPNNILICPSHGVKDACVIGKKWGILSLYHSRCTYVVCFDNQISLLGFHKGILNESGFGVSMDSIPQRYGKNQQMIIDENNDNVFIPRSPSMFSHQIVAIPPSPQFGTV